MFSSHLKQIDTGMARWFLRSMCKHQIDTEELEAAARQGASWCSDGAYRFWWEY